MPRPWESEGRDALGWPGVFQTTARSGQFRIVDVQHSPATRPEGQRLVDILPNQKPGSAGGHHVDRSRAMSTHKIVVLVLPGIWLAGFSRELWGKDRSFTVPSCTRASCFCLFRGLTTRLLQLHPFIQTSPFFLPL